MVGWVICLPNTNQLIDASQNWFSLLLLKPVVSEADRGWAVGMQDVGMHIHESTIPDLIVSGGI